MTDAHAADRARKDRKAISAAAFVSAIGLLMALSATWLVGEENRTPLIVLGIMLIGSMPATVVSRKRRR